MTADRNPGPGVPSPRVETPGLELVRDDGPALAADMPAHRTRRWWRLFRTEWQTHSRLLFLALIGWLAVVWTVPWIAHPLWVLGLGLVFAVVVGPAFGGTDVIHGTEEFAFAFPITRSERFVSRFIVGGFVVLIYSAASIFALDSNFSDVIVRLFVNTGLLPTQLDQPGALYALVMTTPLAVFALSFCAGALASSRTVAFTSWLWGVLGALAILRVALYVEETRWDRLTGYFAVPLLVGVPTFVVAISYPLYRRKEAGVGVAPLRIPLSWWGWLIALLLALAGIGLLGAWLAENFVRLL
jgi:hypothetical protein